MDDLETEFRSHEDLGQDEFRSHEDLGQDDSSDSNPPKARQKLPLARPDPIFKETPRETGFHKSTRICLEQIREAMLHHRWQEAAEYMASYAQVLEDTTVRPGGTAPHLTENIWRIGTEILHNHPNSKRDDYNNFFQLMKHAGVRHQLMISLEHSFHLLVNGLIEEASIQLGHAEGWRYGKETAGQSQRITLVHAYRSLLDYVKWCDKRFTHCNSDDPDVGNNKEMHTYFRQSSVNLKEILKLPGIWDPFILSYTDMLEFYGDHEEVLKVLKDYAYDNTFPPNPNAHVYLYQYFKRHDAPERTLIKVLKILHALVPSHELMLEYCSLLYQSEKESDIPKALGVVLDMLDYACWKSNLDAWNCLKTILHKLKFQNGGDWKDIVSEKMAARKGWWPALHFTSFHARKDSEENLELMEVKASLKTLLCPDEDFNYSTTPLERPSVGSELKRRKSKRSRASNYQENT